MNLIIAGIHTGIGKTICSTIIAEALGFDYWKPIQAGDLNTSDTIFVTKHTTDLNIRIHEEAYRLTQPMSPHAAAKIDNVEIKLSNLHLPKCDNSIIVETAGGIMSPLSDTLVNLDLIKYLNLPVVLVTNDYLGSINHTLLSVEILRGANVPILGLVFSGEKEESSRTFIQNYTKLNTLFEIPFFQELNTQTIKLFANSIKPLLTNLI